MLFYAQQCFSMLVIRCLFVITICYIGNSNVVKGDESKEQLTPSVREEMQILNDRLSLLEERILQQQKEEKKTEECECLERRFVADGELDIETEIIRLRNEVAQLKKGMGSTYIRWGRTTCPGNSSAVYRGYTGGNVYTDNGGPANYVCLPDDPTWAKYQDGIQNEGNHMYGTEYELHGTNFNPFPTNMFDEDAPCAVCKTERSLNIMIPARTNCYSGWHLEYTGYLMTVWYGHPAAGEYICVDANPEGIPHGSENKNGNVLYLVEAVCGSLPCLPYVNGRELACVVCSK